MPESNAIPVRLSDDLIERLDACSKKLGIKRAQLIRYLVERWLEYYEAAGGKVMMPPDMAEIIRVQDGRSRRYQEEKPVGSKEEAERLIERNLQLQKKLASRLRRQPGNGPKQ